MQAEESYVTDQVTAPCHTNEVHIFVKEGGERGDLKFECLLETQSILIITHDGTVWFHMALEDINPEKKISNDDPIYRRMGERLTNTVFLIQSFWSLLINLITNLISLCS